MKINRDAMKELAGKSDAELWRTIREVGTRHGYDLSGINPRHEDLDKIRRMLDGSERMSLSEAMKLLNNYKNGGK